MPREDTRFGAELAALTPLLRSSASRLCRDRERAADLTQETLAKAWQARKRFAAGTNLTAWVLTIMRNQFRSDGRRAWRQAPWDQDAAESIAAPGGAQLHALELSDTVSAIGALSETQREALILVGVGGYSNEDAATVSGCRPKAMKNRVWRARQSLLAMLDGSEPLPRKARRARESAAGTLMSELDRLTAKTMHLARKQFAGGAATPVAAAL